VADAAASGQITGRRLLNQASGPSEHAGKGAAMAAGMRRPAPCGDTADTPETRPLTEVDQDHGYLPR
jgi:hypothetical protein